MFGGLNRLLAATAMVGTVLAVLVAPSAALACGGGPSAVNVYKECIPSGGRGKSTGGHHTSRSGKTGSGTAKSTAKAPTTAPAVVSRRTARALKHASKRDSRVLYALVKGYGTSRLPEVGKAGNAAAAPTAIGSAFDLGSGPTALIIVLAGAAIVLLAAAGARGWRRSHRA